MTEAQDNMQDQPPHIFLEYQGKQVMITLADGREMKHALLQYLERPGVEIDQDIITRLSTSASRFDPDGTLRIGGWLLETRLTALVLTRRQRIGNHFYIKTAFLEKTDAGWRITDITTERYRLRR